MIYTPERREQEFAAMRARMAARYQLQRNENIRVLPKGWSRTDNLTRCTGCDKLIRVYILLPNNWCSRECFDKTHWSLLKLRPDAYEVQKARIREAQRRYKLRLNKNMRKSVNGSVSTLESKYA